MADHTGRDRLSALLQGHDDQFWSVLDDFVTLTEEARRRVLRPHTERRLFGSQSEKERDLRDRLDAVLEELTRWEIGREIGVLPDDKIPSAILDPLRILVEQSESFLRYVNLYQFFAIQFLAGRFFLPEWMQEPPVLPPGPRLTNERPFPFPIPPDPVGGEWFADEAMDRFLALQEEDKQGTVLRDLQLLDDFVEPEKRNLFELWLLGLQPELGLRAKPLWAWANSLAEWAIKRSNFYLALPQPQMERERAAPVQRGRSLTASERPRGGWRITSPLAARFGLADMYWISRMLHAEVTANGTVTYQGKSWFDRLRTRAYLEDISTDSLDKAEEVLRSVFDFVCDMVQNAAEIAEDRERRAFVPDNYIERPKESVAWRQAFDEELVEIVEQRDRRGYQPATSTPPPDASSPQWSERLRSGKRPRNLVGLSFSGGGIRSATFCLGVLQGLQEADLLLQVDYLSTVSGGGFIGSWLVANVLRTKIWLGRLTSWSESLMHLRRYSNYLAPLSGILDADSWTIWLTWARNAFLIQLATFSCICAISSLVLLLRWLFELAGKVPLLPVLKIPLTGLAALLLAVPILLAVLYSLAFTTRDSVSTGLAKFLSAGIDWLTRKRPSLLATYHAGEAPHVEIRQALTGRGIRWLAVVPALLSAYLVASLLWADATGQSALHEAFTGVTTYSGVLTHAWKAWGVILGFEIVAVLYIAYVSLQRDRVTKALLAGIASTAVLYLALCGIMRLLIVWAVDPEYYSGYAFTFTPTLVLLANTIAIVLCIGFSGRFSLDDVREWWTTFGSYLTMSTAAYFALTAAVIFGPFLVLSLWDRHSTLTVGVLLSWAGSVISGLTAGNSNKTSGIGGKTRSPNLELLARLGGLIFLVGAVVGAATIVYVVLVLAGTNAEIAGWAYWPALSAIPGWVLAIAAGVTAACGFTFSHYFEINIFGLNQFYRNRLVRCYLGATRWAPGLRGPQPLTDFDRGDDLCLCELKGPEFRGPFPILNCSLNLGGSKDLELHTRHSSSFILTPIRCGSDRPNLGYAPTGDGGPKKQFAGGVKLGQAVAISGAAASPNMGYNTSPLVAFLLTMFNVRLAWWFPNPGRDKWTCSALTKNLRYLTKELFGLADENQDFVNVSDGGHFENLGVYELVRRRCKVIIAVDAECDEQLNFGSLGNLVRICETDFGVKIDLDVNSIRTQKDGFSLAHYTVGTITYRNGSIGYLVYLKASMTGDEPISIAQYRASHPTFPHETTADQFYSEDQFESYRLLGQHICRELLGDFHPGTHPVDIAEQLYDVLAPAGLGHEAFVQHAKALDAIWERFRQSPELTTFWKELTQRSTPVVLTPIDLTREEQTIGLELLQLMENVFLDLRLEDFWEHPDNRGWAMLFLDWARSPRFRQVWRQSRRVFGIRFEYFCDLRLGLEREYPVARV